MFRINTWWNIVTPNLTEVRRFPVSLVERKRGDLKQGALSWPAVCAKKYWLVGTIACVACHCFKPNAVFSHRASLCA